VESTVATATAGMPSEVLLPMTESGLPNRRMVFIGGPFTGLICPETRLLLPTWRNRYSRLIGLFESESWEVRNAHRREAWGEDIMPPAVHVKLDFEDIRACDLFIAFPGYPASPGTHVEIGWASALGKPMVLLLEEDHPYGSLVAWIDAVADARCIRFRKDEDYLSILAPIIRGDGIKQYPTHPRRQDVFT
jgi:hypothetical protein